MDGQRRIPRSLRRLLADGRDCRIGYRVAMRSGAVLALLVAVMHGAIQGGHMSDGDAPWTKIEDRVAGMMGQVAEGIEITGLEQHDTRLVLNAIGVRPGGSLLGFAPNSAKKRLEALDWVESAAVRREFPNRLLISVVERQPFAIWQVDGSFHVIDRNGVVMSGLDPAKLKGVLLVTGDNANEAVAGLVNQLEAMPDLKAELRAASRVGKRRWNLYLDNGTKILLPADFESEGTRRALALAQSGGVLSGKAAEVDLRIPGSIRIAVAAPEPASTETTASITEQ